MMHGQKNIKLFNVFFLELLVQNVQICIPLPQHLTHCVQNYFNGSNGWMLQRIFKEGTDNSG